MPNLMYEPYLLLMCSDKKTGKIHFSVSCPHSDCDKFLSLIEALHVAVHSHTQSWKALALTLERSEQKKPVKRRVGLTQPAHPSIPTEKSEYAATPMHNGMQSESGTYNTYIVNVIAKVVHS